MERKRHIGNDIVNIIFVDGDRADMARLSVLGIIIIVTIIIIISTIVVSFSQQLIISITIFICVLIETNNSCDCV